MSQSSYSPSPGEARGQLTSHTHDHQRLSGKDGKHNGAQNRGEKHLIDAIALMGLLKHVQRESESRQNTASLTVSTLNILKPSSRQTYLAKYI
jgi:hypothetical protein